MEYVYYHFKTNNISEKWKTSEIEAFLQGCGLFSSDRKQIAFNSQKPFLSITLLNVSDYNSWSENDHDPENTNYIAVVTDDEQYWGANKNEQLRAVFDGLERLLKTSMQDDW